MYTKEILLYLHLYFAFVNFMYYICKIINSLFL